MKTSEILLLSLITFVAIALWIAGPLIAIWCVNTLFGTSIAYSFLNWFAVFLLMGMMRGTCYRRTSSD